MSTKEAPSAFGRVYPAESKWAEDGEGGAIEDREFFEAGYHAALSEMEATVRVAKVSVLDEVIEMMVGFIRDAPKARECIRELPPLGLEGDERWLTYWYSTTGSIG